MDLPPYFTFSNFLSDVSKVLEGKVISELQCQTPRDLDDVNHLILNNKDGRQGWRPLQLIHPVLYISLVNRITEKENWKLIRNRFIDFAKNKKIKCQSLPVESLIAEKDKATQISRWWQTIEQKSIELALDYDFVIHTDIVDCYGAIYTHSIAWAIHTKAEAKKKENRNNKSLIGNIIDNHIQDMRYGQTNGIPQGTVLMDFIAEMVLGYADIELTERLSHQKIGSYDILRYRDDYRIFANSSQDGEHILKSLTEVMIDLGLKLSPAKTKVSSQVIRSSLKDEKLSWICRRQTDKNLQKHLLIIYNHSIEYPNAGSLAIALGDYYKRISCLKKYDHAIPLISIVVDIAYHNTRTYPICAAILSKLISLLEGVDKQRMVVEKTKKKFSKIPNTGYMEIWLQRISFPFNQDIIFETPLCRLVLGETEQIWNSEWISSTDLKRKLDPRKIIDQTILSSVEPIISVDEVALFAAKAQYVS